MCDGENKRNSLVLHMSRNYERIGKNTAIRPVFRKWGRANVLLLDIIIKLGKLKGCFDGRWRAWKMVWKTESWTPRRLMKRVLEQPTNLLTNFKPPNSKNLFSGPTPCNVVVSHSIVLFACTSLIRSDHKLTSPAITKKPRANSTQNNSIVVPRVCFHGPYVEGDFSERWHMNFSIERVSFRLNSILNAMPALPAVWAFA